MSFTDAIKTCFRKYVTFSGRATRPEYWYFVLFGVLGSIAAAILDTILFGTQNTTVTDSGASVSTGNGPIAGLFNLVIFLPSLAAGWRRMHDTGKSGLYLLYPLIAFIGVMSYAAFIGLLSAEGGALAPGAFTGIAGIILILALIVVALAPLLVIWWLTRPTQPHDNQYGPNPREVSP